jgi:hypothetical protein
MPDTAFPEALEACSLQPIENVIQCISSNKRKSNVYIVSIITTIPKTKTVEDLSIILLGDITEVL